MVSLTSPNSLLQTIIPFSRPSAVQSLQRLKKTWTRALVEALKFALLKLLLTKTLEYCRYGHRINTSFDIKDGLLPTYLTNLHM
jgi:hypothetical protein